MVHILRKLWKFKTTKVQCTMNLIYIVSCAWLLVICYSLTRWLKDSMYKGSMKGEGKNIDGEFLSLKLYQIFIFWTTSS